LAHSSTSWMMVLRTVAKDCRQVRQLLRSEVEGEVVEGEVSVVEGEVVEGEQVWEVI